MSGPEQSLARNGKLYHHVDPHDPHCLKQILELARALAWRRFSGLPDDEERVNDTVSLAWEFAQRGRGTPYTVVKFAIRQAATGGQFSRTTRSIDHSQPKESKAQRRFFDADNTAAFDGNSAEHAAFRIDFADWLETLTEPQREVAGQLAMGRNDVEIGRNLGCTRSIVWIIRQALKKSYLAVFMDESEA